jgi:hypothetical protein
MDAVGMLNVVFRMWRGGTTVDSPEALRDHIGAEDRGNELPCSLNAII